MKKKPVQFTSQMINDEIRRCRAILNEITVMLKCFGERLAEMRGQLERTPSKTEVEKMISNAVVTVFKKTKRRKGKT